MITALTYDTTCTGAARRIRPHGRTDRQTELARASASHACNSMGLCVTNITYLPDRTYLLIPRDPRSGEGGHAAPGALSNTETQAEARGMSRPPASPRDYGGELHNGRCEAPVDRRATEHPCRARKIFFYLPPTLHKKKLGITPHQQIKPLSLNHRFTI